MAIAAFLIMFREGIEAALIIAIIVAYLVKINRQDMKKYAWIGSGFAIILSLGIGYVVFVTFGTLTGVSEQLFEGIASILATSVLTAMIFWMAKNAKNLKGNLQYKIDTLVTRKYVLGIALLAFIVVFREGIETVLFLTALYGIDFTGTLIGTIGGIVLSVVIAVLLLKGTVRLPLQKFFKYSSVLLIIFAAGLFGYGIHELMEVGEGLGYDWGVLGEHAYDINPSDSSHMLHEKGSVGSIFKALIGYDGNPEILRVIVYLGYWLIIGGYFLKTYSSGPIFGFFRFNGGKLDKPTLKK